jgi:nitrate reductase gamma subunit
MRLLFPLSVVVALVALVFVGVEAGQMQPVFGVFLPYAAFAIFVGGVVARVVTWGKAPVPFRIPTTCGQQKSLPWIKHSSIENPTTATGVLKRMFLEIFLFRSLFRNTKAEYGTSGPKLVYGSDKILWLASLAFHYAFLTVLVWHLRFFTQPVPFFVAALESADGFMQVTVPSLLQSGFVLLAAAGFLLARRLYIPQVRYISQPADYFPLFMIIAIVAVKALTMGLASLNPKVPQGIGVLFYIHVALVSVLFAYFPFSKLVHMGGVWLSPTRNMANNNRMVRHINPWNHPVKVHTYEEYEDEYREVMIGAGLPVDKKESKVGKVHA